MAGFVADLVERLQELGFSAYEAKAYLALLRKNPSTGYELSRISGIPSAKIYETIDRLQSRGALAIVLGNPVRYVPITPGELISRVRCRFESSLDGLEDALDREATESSPEFVWNIRQYDLILGRAAELVRAATREVAVFAWAEECMHLAGEPRAARHTSSGSGHTRRGTAEGCRRRVAFEPVHPLQREQLPLLEAREHLRRKRDRDRLGPVRRGLPGPGGRADGRHVRADAGEQVHGHLL